MDTVLYHHRAPNWDCISLYISSTAPLFPIIVVDDPTCSISLHFACVTKLRFWSSFWHLVTCSYQCWHLIGDLYFFNVSLHVTIRICNIIYQNFFSLILKATFVTDKWFAVIIVVINASMATALYLARKKYQNLWEVILSHVLLVGMLYPLISPPFTANITLFYIPICNNYKNSNNIIRIINNSNNNYTSLVIFAVVSPLLELYLWFYLSSI